MPEARPQRRLMVARIRPVQPGDRDAVAQAFAGLSERSRYRRYLGAHAQELSDEELHAIVDVDHDERETLLALDPGTGQTLGVARYVRLPDDPQRAELAIAVGDEHQRQGVGRALLDELIDCARERGVTRVCADVLAENRPMIALLEQLGAVRVSSRDGSVRELEIELPPGRGAGEGLAEALRAAAAGRLRTVWQEGADPLRSVLTDMLGRLRRTAGR